MIIHYTEVNEKLWKKEHYKTITSKEKAMMTKLSEWAEMYWNKVFNEPNFDMQEAWDRVFKDRRWNLEDWC